MSEKKLVVVSSDNMYALNGGAKFVKMFHDNIDYFEGKHITLTTISNSEGFNNQQTYVKGVKYKVKKFIKILLSKSRLGERYKFKLYLRISQKVVRKIKFSNEDTCYILNDYKVAYSFYQEYPKVKHSIFMMHNNGDLLSMLDARMLNDRKIYNKLTLMEKTIYEKAERIVFVSENARKTFVSKNAEYADKAITIYNGLPKVDCTDISKKQYEYLNLVTVGTLGERKNQKSIIDALKEIDDPTIKLTCVGGGDVEYFSRYAKECGLGENVNVVGPQQDVSEYLLKANLFVSASLNEGLPISAQEAMSYGLPLILTNVGGCSELIEGNGILIEPELGQLVNALEYYNKHKFELIEQGNNSISIFIEKFELFKMFNNYIKVMNEILL